MTNMNYYLRRNPLAAESELPYMARVARKETLRQDDVIDRMMKKNTTVTRQDILVVLDLMKETVMEEALSGNPIIMDLFKVKPGIKGGFASSADEFDRNRHNVSLNLNASAEFRKSFVNSAALTKVGARVDEKTIEHLFDYASWSIAENFPAGGTMVLKGRNLLSDVVPEVYLVAEGSEDALPVAKVFNHGVRSIICSLPADLAPGRYTLSVVLKRKKKSLTMEYDNPITIT